MTDQPKGEALYRVAAEDFGAAIARLARSVEANSEKARDLEQDIHVALWRSFGTFDGRASLKTWTYRVAHNVAASHARSQTKRKTAPLSDAGDVEAPDNPEAATGEAMARARLMAAIRRMTPEKRQLALLYLEGLETAEIAEVLGIKANAVSVRIHRLKADLTAHFSKGDAA